MEIKENVQPIFKNNKRGVSFASIEKIDQELARLENTGILAKVQSMGRTLGLRQKKIRGYSSMR